MDGGNIVFSLGESRGIDLSALSWGHLSDPFLLGDMEEAVFRTRSALQKKEKVGIIGDYDADGITGVAQLVRFFRRNGVEPLVILPHRERDGYGVKEEFIRSLHANGVSLLFTVDTGISAMQQTSLARSLGMDVIILDHHSPAPELPDAILVHPALLTTNYSLLTHLSGSGVVFTFLRAFENDWEEKNIDVALAAIGTVADVVPLLGENRTIVTLGLEAMNTGGDAPVFALAHAVRKEGEEIRSSHIGFRIAPRINAAGRLSDPLLSLHALLEGGSKLSTLHTLNEERQDLLEEMLKIAEGELDCSSPFLGLASASFHPGIVGLIAGKLTERFGKPSIVGCERENIITCSLRSVKGYDVTEALRRHASHLSSFGGHALAAGCTLEKEKWNDVTKLLQEDAQSVLNLQNLLPTLTIDAVIDRSDLTLPFGQSLSLLEPYGAGNKEPLFLLRGQKLSGARSVGKEARHLQCFLGGVKAVGFGLGTLLPSLPEEADIVCRLGINTWNGRGEVQIFIEDIAKFSLESVYAIGR